MKAGKTGRLRVGGKCLDGKVVLDIKQKIENPLKFLSEDVF